MNPYLEMHLADVERHRQAFLRELGDPALLEAAPITEADVIADSPPSYIFSAEFARACRVRRVAWVRELVERNAYLPNSPDAYIPNSPLKDAVFRYLKHFRPDRGDVGGVVIVNPGWRAGDVGVLLSVSYADAVVAFPMRTEAMVFSRLQLFHAADDELKRDMRVLYTVRTRDVKRSSC